MNRLKRIGRVLNEMAHCINDPLPGEKWFMPILAVLWLWVCAKHGWL